MLHVVCNCSVLGPVIFRVLMFVIRRRCKKRLKISVLRKLSLLTCYSDDWVFFLKKSFYILCLFFSYNFLFYLYNSDRSCVSIIRVLFLSFRLFLFSLSFYICMSWNCARVCYCNSTGVAEDASEDGSLVTSVYQHIGRRPLRSAGMCRRITGNVVSHSATDFYYSFYKQETILFCFPAVYVDSCLLRSDTYRPSNYFF